MKMMTGVAAAGVALTALLSGCGAKVEGGDTTCKDYLAANDADRQTALTKMIKDQSGNDPSQLEITAKKALVQGFCQTVGKEDSKIKETPLT